MSESRIAVVTGAASGIGAATARRLAADGARVALLGRRGHRLTELARQLDGRGLAIITDVTDPAAVDAAAAAVHDAFGPADIVVNAAGVMLPNPIGAGRTDEWARMIDTNLTGALHVMRAFGPGLLGAAAQGRPADLVNVSSIGAHLAFPDYAVYSATKAALSMLSESVRTEFGPQRVRVTAIEPGLTRTELGEHLDNAALSRQLAAMFEVIDALSAEDVADLIAYVTSRPRHVNLSRLVVLPVNQA
ncbi:SDR family oxidoreductase [Actinoplanes sp. NPDC049548]|uniref:SDR family oxidoreductase n=1 Tax=Actinoplanes sp. NPDC049548 TaxID=3155152 RepID=UPI00342A71E2